jgi:hypothetical protein
MDFDNVFTVYTTAREIQTAAAALYKDEMWPNEASSDMLYR